MRPPHIPLQSRVPQLCATSIQLLQAASTSCTTWNAPAPPGLHAALPACTPQQRSTLQSNRVRAWQSSSCADGCSSQRAPRAALSSRPLPALPVPSRTCAVAVHRNPWEAFPAGPAARKGVCKACIQVFCTGMEFCKNIKLLIRQSCLTRHLPCEQIVNYLPYARGGRGCDRKQNKKLLLVPSTRPSCLHPAGVQDESRPEETCTQAHNHSIPGAACCGLIYFCTARCVAQLYTNK